VDIRIACTTREKEPFVKNRAGETTSASCVVRQVWESSRGLANVEAPRATPDSSLSDSRSLLGVRAAAARSFCR